MILKTCFRVRLALSRYYTALKIVKTFLWRSSFNKAIGLANLGFDKTNSRLGLWDLTIIFKRYVEILILLRWDLILQRLIHENVRQQICEFHSTGHISMHFYMYLNMKHSIYVSGLWISYVT